jgi:membrane fusion protein, multidrug efflux system
MKDRSFPAANSPRAPGRCVLGVGILCLGLILAGTTGCERKQAKSNPDLIPNIPVSHPVQEKIIDYVYFTGRTEAVHMVDVRPRVTGYLVRSAFKEGEEVKEGALLFEVDPRPYQAQLDQAVSQIGLNESALRLAETTYERDRAIASVPGAVSLQQLDQDKAAVDEAAARVRSARASTEVYKLNLDFTQVKSPIDGQISRFYLTKGNLVNQDQSLLTTVVSLDPMYVYFDLDEPTLLRVRLAINKGLVQRPQDGVNPVFIGLQDEAGFPHQGAIDFVNNQVNPTTGSISVRGVFANPRPVDACLQLVSALGQASSSPTALLAGWTAETRVRPPQKSDRLLSPGMFVRVKLPIGISHSAVLVVDRAITSRQGKKSVYVLDAKEADPKNKVAKVRSRPITTGPLLEDGLRVVYGLTADDWVVVGGLQQVEDGKSIHPEEKPMPFLSTPK